MDKRISQFIRRQTCLSCCSVDPEGNPWCFSAFYAFHEEGQLLFVKSSSSSRHGESLAKNRRVAGTLLPDKLSLLHIKGVQFEGELLAADHPAARDAYASYHKRFPFSIAMPGEVWTIRLQYVKFTDNSLGFGKKLNWSREEATVANQQSL